MFSARRRLIGALGAFGAFAAAPVAAQFRVEISGVGATQMPVVVAAFRDEAASGTPIAPIIRADLQRSGLFRINETSAVLDERSMVSAPEWRSRATDAVVAGSVTRLPDGRYDVRFKLWDVVKGEELLGQSRVVLAGDLRLAAHRVADEVYQALTGEPGVFATRIAYVVRNGRRFTLHVTDADGEGGQVALASPEPIISPAWSPNGLELAYVSFEMQKAVVWVQSLSTGCLLYTSGGRAHASPAQAPGTAG